MIRTHAIRDGKLVLSDAIPDAAGLRDVIWVDLLSPSLEEERAIEVGLGVQIPTREEMQEIEISSRLYQANGARYMIATILAAADSPRPEKSIVTFVLKDRRLITVRYTQPRSFGAFTAHADRHPEALASGESVLLGLLEAIVDRMADVLEGVGADIDTLTNDTFGSATKRHSPANYRAVLGRVGRDGDLLGKARESLVSISRIATHVHPASPGAIDAALGGRLQVLVRDAQSLTDHAGYLASNLNFLLNATLGLINTEQNEIIKIFSVAAVMFLPPTLVASIYGMNFRLMPELAWPFGYPLALGLMVLSAALPLMYFRRRGWL